MTVTLASYAVEDVVYASPLAKKSVQTDAEGNFSIQWHETKSNVAYALKVVDDSADGVEYNPYFMELNVFSGSPSYDHLYVHSYTKQQAVLQFFFLWILNWVFYN